MSHPTDYDKNNPFSHHTLSKEKVKAFYDRFGAFYSFAEKWEGQPKKYLRDHLELNDRQLVLNVGVGTGMDQGRICRIVPSYSVIGVDLSRKMLTLTHNRIGSPVVQADARRLPFQSESFDRIYCTYLMDIFPPWEAPSILAELSRVLKSGGRLGLITLTEGATPLSRLFIAIWEGLFSIQPSICGGCRPQRISRFLPIHGLHLMESQVFLQMGVPSEVTIVEKQV